MSADLILTELAAGYGQQAVVRNISARFQPGELGCILGANGAGKTTLLRAIAGYLPLTAGSVRLGTTELNQLAPRQRARYIAAAPQVAQEILPLTVQQAVAMARYPHLTARMRLNGVDGQAVDDALKALQLEELAHHQCGNLSGGEWRRVLIAQGLAQQTPVLLLDEPTAFLDPPAQRRILSYVRRLSAERGLIVLAVLHAVDLALEFADRTLLLRNGEMLACDTPAALLHPEMLAQLYNCGPEWLGKVEVPQ
jgi:iron complex transport system ATP-binding protein